MQAVRKSRVNLLSTPTLPPPQRIKDQSAAASLAAALPPLASIIVLIAARAAPPYALGGGKPGGGSYRRLTRGPDGGGGGKGGPIVSTGSGGGGVGRRLRTLLSGDRERERLDRAVSAAIEAGGGVDGVAELWAIVELDPEGPGSDATGADANPASYALVRAVDNGISPAAVLVRTWPLSELRQIDGFGQPASGSLEFALSFTGAAAPVLLRTDNPRSRARFIWSISQLFAHKMRRKPPTTGLLLLDLQQFADDSGPPTATIVGRGSRQAGDLYGNGMEQVPTDDTSDDMSGEKLAKVEAAGNDRERVGCGVRFNVSSPRIVRTISAPNPSAAAEASRKSRPFPLLDPDDTTGEDGISKASGGTGRTGGTDGTGATAGTTVTGGTCENNRTGRTRVSAFRVAEYSDVLDGPMAIRRQPASAAEFGDARTKYISSAELRDMNIDQRAFLVAASRLGGLNDDDGVEVLLERRRREVEKRAFHMTSEEGRDMDLIVSSVEREKGCQSLSNFEKWLDAEVAQLEVVNITETLAVEQDAPALFEPLVELKEALSASDGWFRKCEARLTPHASIVEDIRIQRDAIQVQRQNVFKLESTLTKLLEDCALTEDEQNEVDATITALYSSAEAGLVVTVEDGIFRNRVIPCALGGLACKANQPASPLSEIRAIAGSRENLRLQQQELSSLMFPALENGAQRIASSWKSERSPSVLAHFGNAAYALVTLDATNLEKLEAVYERYVARSASATGIGGVMRKCWTESEAEGLACQLDAVFERACRLCDSEARVAHAMFCGAARAAGVSVRSTVESVLASRFEYLSSTIVDLVDECALKNSVPVYWMAYLEVQASVDGMASALGSSEIKSAASVASVSAHESEGGIASSSLRSLSLSDHWDLMESLNRSREGDAEFNCRIFLVRCLRGMADRFRKLVEMQVGGAVGAMPSRASDSIQSSSPERVFESVQALMKVCFELVDAWTNSGVGAAERELLRKVNEVKAPRELSGVAATKGMCDRLVAAAFKRIESSAVASHQRSGMAKLECYSYISQRLFTWTEANVDEVFDGALNLALRGRQHATRLYTSRAVRTYFGVVEDASRAPSGDVRTRLHSAMRLRGGPRSILNVMRRDMMEAMSPPARAARVDAALWECCMVDVRICLDACVERLRNRDGLEEEAASVQAYRDEILF